MTLIDLIGTFVCDEHGDRVSIDAVREQIDGAVVVRGPLMCSECGKQLKLVVQEE